MTVTRADVMTQALGQRMGARYGTVLSGSKSAAILSGLINTNANDDSAFQADRILFLTATAEEDKEKSIDIWTDQTGEARFQPRTNAVVAGDPYIIVSREDYSLFEIRQALDYAQSYARRTYRQVIPITPNLDLYPLTQMDWLQGAGSIDAVWISQSPTWLHNEAFDLWQNGAQSTPDGYTLEGTGAVTVRVSGGLRSPYRAIVLAGPGAPARLVQAIPQSLCQWLTRRVAPVFTPLRAAAWLQTTFAASTRVFIRYTETSSGSPVTTYVYSDYLTADGNPYFLDVSLTPTATMNDFTWGVEALANGGFQVSSGLFLQSTATAQNLFALRDQGSQAYLEQELYNAVRNVGGVPTVELTYPTWTPYQLIVYSRRPYPALTADSDIVEDQQVDILQWGLLNFLLRNVKVNQDRSRYDYILYGDKTPGNSGASGIWSRYLNNVTDLPVARPPQQVVIGAA